MMVYVREKTLCEYVYKIYREQNITYKGVETFP